MGLNHHFKSCVFDANILGGAKLFSRDRGSYTNYIRFYFYHNHFYANGGKWEAKKGSGNVEADPLLRSDFGIPLNSPAYGAGLFISGFHDAAGRADFYGRLYQPATGRYTFKG